MLSEILATEEKYVWDMDILKTVFYHPLAASGWLDKQDMDLIFSNIEVIIRVTNETASRLGERFNASYKSEDHMVGDVFLSMVSWWGGCVWC